MYKIRFKPTFVRQYKKLIPALQEEVKERIEILKLDPKHQFLKTHKSTGKLQEFWSCSVNYQYRIIFEYEKSDTIVLLMVGDHGIYK